MLFHTYFKPTKLSWILLQLRNTIALLTSRAVFSHNNSQHSCKQQVMVLYSHSRTKQWYAHWQGPQSQVTSMPTLTVGLALGAALTPFTPSGLALLACFLSQGLDQSSSLLPFPQSQVLLGISLTSSYRQSKLEVALRSTGRTPQDVRELGPADALCLRPTSGWARSANRSKELPEWDSSAARGWGEFSI